MRRTTRPRRKTRAAVAKAAPALEPEATASPPRTRRRKKASGTDTRVVHLAMSPGAANFLRTLIGKARYSDQPELDAIKKELEDTLKEMGL